MTAEKKEESNDFSSIVTRTEIGQQMKDDMDTFSRKPASHDDDYYYATQFVSKKDNSDE